VSEWPFTLPGYVLQAIVAGIAIGMVVKSTFSPAVYTRDLQEEYLTASALRDGGDILTPVSELSGRYFPVTTDNFTHPNPHPPILAALALPLTFLSFPASLRCWIAVNLGVLLWLGRRLSMSPTASLALAAWPPLWAVLVLGQLELVIVALAVQAWSDASEERDGRAGIFLGVAAVLKLYPLLLVVPYLARRRFRLVAAACITFAVGQVANVAVVGPAGFLRYYTEVLPAVTATYTPLGLNVSWYGALLRLFGGSADIGPVWSMPGIVAPLAAGGAVAALVALWRMAPMAAPTALFAVLPTVWYYHPVIALPQIRRLVRFGPRLTALAATAATAAIFPLVNWAFESGFLPRSPSLVALLAGVEPLGLGVLLWLSWRESADEPVSRRPA
jgi:hypothetical protein